MELKNIFNKESILNRAKENWDYKDKENRIKSSHKYKHIFDKTKILWTDWSEELTILMNIKDGMSKLEDLTGDSEDAVVIGALLENIDDSKLINKSSSQNVANKIVSNLTDGKITSVSKHENGWEYTFETLIDQLNGGN